MPGVSGGERPRDRGHKRRISGFSHKSVRLWRRRRTAHGIDRFTAPPARGLRTDAVRGRCRDPSERRHLDRGPAGRRGRGRALPRGAHSRRVGGRGVPDAADRGARPALLRDARLARADVRARAPVGARCGARRPRRRRGGSAIRSRDPVARDPLVDRARADGDAAGAHRRRHDREDGRGGRGRDRDRDRGRDRARARTSDRAGARARARAGDRARARGRARRFGTGADVRSRGGRRPRRSQALRLVRLAVAGAAEAGGRDLVGHGHGSRRRGRRAVARAGGAGPLRRGPVSDGRRRARAGTARTRATTSRSTTSRSR